MGARGASGRGATAAVALVVASFGCRAAADPAGGSAVSSNPGHVHHAIDYLELAAPDLVACKAFYQGAFGWRFTDYGPEYAGFTLASGGREMGGVRQGAAGPTGGPLVIVYSEDLDATLAKVQAAGGKITTAPFTFPGGRRFHFQDPAGNELAVWAEK